MAASGMYLEFFSMCVRGKGCESAITLLIDDDYVVGYY